MFRLLLVVFFAILVKSSVVNLRNIDAFTAPSFAMAEAPTQFSDSYFRDAEILGGERDVAVFLDSGSESHSVTCRVGYESVSIMVLGHGEGGATLQYDGMDGSMKLNPNAMKPTDLYSGGARGIRLMMTMQDTCELLMFISTTSGRCSLNVTLLPQVHEYLLDYRYFQTTSGRLCNFTSVTTLELNILVNAPNLIGISAFTIYKDDTVPFRLDTFAEMSVVHFTLGGSHVYPDTFPSCTLCCSPTAVGGQRDFYVTVSKAIDQTPALYSNMSNGEWNMSVTGAFLGTATIQYDGFDVSEVLVATGLEKLDFSAKGVRKAFRLAFACDVPTEGQIIIHWSNGFPVTSAASFTHSGAGNNDVIILFSAFAPPADMTSVGAMEVIFFIEGLMTLRLWELTVV